MRILPSLGDAKDPNAAQLPFHIAVLAPLSDNPEGVAYRERRFVEIDRDNLDSVLSAMKPVLRFKVENKLSEDSDTQLLVELRFQSMDDFGPAWIARQIRPLRELLSLRNHLHDLCRLIYRNDKAEELLRETVFSEASSWRASSDVIPPRRSDFPRNRR